MTNMKTFKYKYAFIKERVYSSNSITSFTSKVGSFLILPNDKVLPTNWFFKKVYILRCLIKLMSELIKFKDLSLFLKIASIGGSFTALLFISNIILMLLGVSLW